jgi:transposase
MAAPLLYCSCFVLFYCDEPIAMTLDPTPAPPNPDQPAPSSIRDKLPPERVALMRDWVECTTRSFKSIGQELGVSASTISRYAAEGGWQRPPGAAQPSRPARPNPAPERRRNPVRPPTGEQRERITQKLWRLAERHAEELEDQPVEVAHRALQPLARLTRTLGEMDRHARPPQAPHDYEIDAPKPRRSLSELRDELVAHLERIEREEGRHWDIREWWFNHGEGI